MAVYRIDCPLPVQSEQRSTDFRANRHIPKDSEMSSTVNHSDGVPIIAKGVLEVGNSDLNLNKSTSATGSTPKVLPTEFYTPFISDAAKSRKPSPIRGLLPLEQTPGLISLLAGKPNSSTFPISSLSFTIKSPSEPHKDVQLNLKEEDLAEGLQYTNTAGVQRLLDWLTGLQERSHGRKIGEGWRVSMGSGSQDLIYKSLLAILNPGDPVLVESPVYAGVLPILHSLNSEMVDIETDEHGIKSSNLRYILENWPAFKPKPKLLYTVPYGCNPTGMSASLERRREVLALAREHNFLIMEDDPYFYLYYGSASRSPSYFALENELPEVGRVIRLDSLSKIVSSGLRIGFASAPLPILQAVETHTASLNLQVSSLTQAIAFEILNSWGYEGFIKHTEKVADFYKSKRDVFEKAMRKYLDGLAEWSVPEAGMFYWFKLLVNPPDRPNAVEEDSKALIETKAFEHGVLALPGTVFLPGGEKTAYVRASFSLLDEQDVKEALRRLREVVLEERARISALPQ